MTIRRNSGLRLACMAMLAGMAQSGLASPTSNEFERCDDMRDASFRYCMEAAAKSDPSPDESACRTRSQEMKDACYRRVYEQYRRPSPAEQAERERLTREARRRAAQAAP
jgi:hypothetical protein